MEHFVTIAGMHCGLLQSETAVLYLKTGTPGGIRTHDPRFRRPLPHLPSYVPPYPDVLKVRGYCTWLSLDGTRRHS